jgi:hypothetical protein
MACSGTALLYFISRIWWPRIISNEKLWKEANQENVNIEIRRSKFSWIGHTLRKRDREPCKAALMWNPQGSRQREQLVEKHINRSWENELGELRPIARDEKMEETRRQPVFLMERRTVLLFGPNLNSPD